ncbi:PREDICTED: ribosome biogenesis protein WDR12 homolog [Dinoponera quadriceps]|uniref:Ribosome biogenesis protein WDR12 homolog n=1 Tax=Dinoponera quadriceps TaxID=609295 RepID=A0A6P3XYS5_DINQU|nr:PREDICTED: ribosome biogenesis protein WDR12 homolog [Dinoponera quadriceps]
MASTNNQIQIRLITKLQQYAVPDYPLSVDVSIDASELNTIVNKLLKESKNIQNEVNFNFLISSQLLRTSLREHIVETGVSIEELIDVEYVEKYVTPEPQDCLIHDDWVSTVAVCNKWILTGCYDNTLHIWTSTGKHRLVIPGHASPIKAVAWISVSDYNASFVSASQDKTVVIWDWDIVKNSVERMHICRGHEKSLEAVSVNHDTTLMATGSWDTTLKIWSTSIQDEQRNGESSPKRAKMEDGKTRVSMCTMKGHKDAISGVRWSDKTEIITSSWDHTLKIWDSELGSIKCEFVGEKTYFDVDYSPLAHAVITASADKHVRLYDPRSSEGIVMKTLYISHTQWVQCVRWSSMNEHLFISGAYDGIVKLWDTRSPKTPLFDLTGHEDKVLCCDWSHPRLIVSGGADNTLRIFV